MYTKTPFTRNGRNKKVRKNSIELEAPGRVTRKRKEIVQLPSLEEDCLVIGKKSVPKVQKSVYEWPADNLPVRKTMLGDLIGNVIPLLVRQKARTHVEKPKLLEDFLSGKRSFR